MEREGHVSQGQRSRERIKNVRCDEPSDEDGALFGHVEVYHVKLGFVDWIVYLTCILLLLWSIYRGFVIYYLDMKVDLTFHTMPPNQPGLGRRLSRMALLMMSMSELLCHTLLIVFLAMLTEPVKRNRSREFNRLVNSPVAQTRHCKRKLRGLGLCPERK